MTDAVRARAGIGVRRARGAAATAVAAALILAAVTTAAAQERTTLALLPFENVSGSVQGARIIMPMLERALRGHGYRVVGPERLEPFLARNRVRDPGRLSRAQVTTIEREFGAGLAMLGSVAIFNDSTENPQWGLSARLLATDSGAIVWVGSAGFTGDDFTIALGLGTVTSGARLAEKTVDALLRDLPRAGEPLAAPARPRPLRTRLFRPKASYRSPTLDPDPPKRVAVLPFENLSERKGAGRIVTDVFVDALVRTGRFDVVEPGTVSEALLEIGVAPYGNVTFEVLAALRQRIEADAVIVGTVFTYSEGLKRTGATSPEVAFDARMLDAESGRILWLAERVRDGDDSRIVLHFGTFRAVMPLILRVADEMAGTL